MITGGNGDLTKFGINVVPFENVEAPQLKAYQDFINKMPFNDWVLFLDLDEFYEGNKPHDLLKPYQHCDTVRLNWKCFGSQGQIKYEDRPVWERFNIPLPKDCVFNKDLPNGITENCHIKNFYHKTMKPAEAQIHNTLVMGGLCVDASGRHENGLSPFQNVCWDFAFVKHFITKSAEEFAQRRFNTADACGNVVATNDKLIDRFFNLNGYDEKTDKFFKEYLANAETRGNSEGVQPVSSECDTERVQPMGESEGPETDCGESKQTNGRLHKRVRAGEK